MGHREKERLQLAKRLSVGLIERDRKMAEKAESLKVKKEIQKYIRQKYEEGKTPEEILKRLNFVFGKQKYQKYRPYFETWVENIVSKETSKGEERE